MYIKSYTIYPEDVSHDAMSSFVNDARVCGAIVTNWTPITAIKDPSFLFNRLTNSYTL